jgi:hypothetical protein
MCVDCVLAPSRIAQVDPGDEPLPEVVLPQFIMEHIIHRFNISQTLTTDQDTSFVSCQVREFIKSYKIRLLNSSPYYAQANG